MKVNKLTCTGDFAVSKFDNGLLIILQTDIYSPAWLHQPSNKMQDFLIDGNLSLRCKAFIFGYKIDIYTFRITEFTLCTVQGINRMEGK